MIYMVMLYVDGVQQAFGMRFRSKGAAMDAYEKVKDSETANPVEIEDDFGQRVTFYPARSCALHLIDFAREQEAHGEMRLMQARAEELLQQKMAALHPETGVRALGQPNGEHRVRPS